MKSAIVFLFILSKLSFLVSAQVRLAGLVTEQSSNNRPIVGVEVSGNDANPVVTGNDGHFILTFQDLEAGESITLEAKKNGWEVVNTEALQMQLPKFQARPFKIVICLAGRLAENRKKFYKISDSTITRRYKERIEALNRKSNDWKQDSVRLTEELKRLKREARDLANRFSKINFDDIFPVQQQAFDLFQDGKTGEALKLLETIDSRKDIAQAQFEKKKGRELRIMGLRIEANADSVIQQHINKLLFQADLYKLNFQFIKAEEAYGLAVEADTANLANAFMFANFLQDQNEHNKAILWYEKIIRADTTASIAVALNNLGLLYHEENSYRAAQRAFMLALDIFERGFRIDSATYRPLIASTLINLGNLYRDKNDSDSAQLYLERGLAIYERLNQTDSITYKSHVAKALNDLGVVYRDKINYVAAQQAYERALDVYERLSQTNPAIYESFVAKILNNLGVLYRDKKDNEAAQKAFGRALIVQKRLAKINPDAFEPDVSTTLNNLGILHENNNDYVSAQQAYEQGLAIQERLVKINPAVYGLNFCRLAILLGNCLTKQTYQPEIYNKVRTNLKQVPIILARYIDNSLSKKMQKDADELIHHFTGFDLFKDMYILKQQVAAITDNQEKIRSQHLVIQRYVQIIAEGYPEFLEDLGAAYGNLGWYLILDRQFIQAERISRKALSLADTVKSDKYNSMLKGVQTNLALALLFQGNYADAENVYRTLKDQSINNITYKDAFLADLRELEKAGITHPDVIKIRKLLQP